MDIGRTEKLSITVSILFHALILACLALGMGGTSANRSNQFLAVELFESPGGAKSPPGGSRAHAPEPKRAATVNHSVRRTHAKTHVVKTKAPQVPMAEEVQTEKKPVPQEADHDTSETSDITLASADVKAATLSLPGETSRPFSSVSAERGAEGGEQGPSGGSGGQAAGREVRIGEIRSAIQSAVVYPLIARRRGLEGTVIASFIVDETGIPRDVQVLKSSGHRIFDREVVRVIYAASPYPAVGVAVEVPVTFRLTDIASR